MEAKNLQFVDDKALVNLLMYGHDNFSDDENHDILKATINFIRKTSRFTNLNISETIWSSGEGDASVGGRGPSLILTFMFCALVGIARI